MSSKKTAGARRVLCEQAPQRRETGDRRSIVLVGGWLARPGDSIIKVYRSNSTLENTD